MFAVSCAPFERRRYLNFAKCNEHQRITLQPTPYGRRGRCAASCASSCQAHPEDRLLVGVHLPYPRLAWSSKQSWFSSDGIFQGKEEPRRWCKLVHSNRDNMKKGAVNKGCKFDRGSSYVFEAEVSVLALPSTRKSHQKKKRGELR